MVLVVGVVWRGVVIYLLVFWSLNDQLFKCILKLTNVPLAHVSLVYQCAVNQEVWVSAGKRCLEKKTSCLCFFLLGDGVILYGQVIYCMPDLNLCFVLNVRRVTSLALPETPLALSSASPPHSGAKAVASREFTESYHFDILQLWLVFGLEGFKQLFTVERMYNFVKSDSYFDVMKAIVYSQAFECSDKTSSASIACRKTHCALFA